MEGPLIRLDRQRERKRHGLRFCCTSVEWSEHGCKNHPYTGEGSLLTTKKKVLRKDNGMMGKINSWVVISLLNVVVCGSVCPSSPHPFLSLLLLPFFSSIFSRPSPPKTLQKEGDKKIHKPHKSLFIM